MMPEVDKLKFEKVFKIINFGLWMNGSHPALPRGWQLRSLVTLSICSICFILLCNSILLHRIPNSKFGDMTRESIMAVLAFTLVCKYTTVVRNRHIILNLIRYMDSNMESNDVSEAESKVILKYMNKGVFVMKFWFVMTLFSGNLFVFKALIATLYSYCKGELRYVPIFEVVYPSFLEIHKNDLPVYIGFSCLSIVFDFCSVVGYMGFEPLVAIFLLHFCGQLEILSIRMMNMFKNANGPEEVLNKLKQINLQLKTIYKLAENVQVTFVALFEFNMKTTTFLIPFAAFQIVDDLRRDVISIEFLSLLPAILLQFYMPCYYSHQLMEKSEFLRQAIYSCGWEEHPNNQIRKIVNFMLTRTSKPVVLRTIFYPLTLETFAEMARQSFALYNIMNAVWL